MDISGVNITPYSQFSPDGYCCEDHDGPYEEYKSYQWEYRNDENKKRLKEFFYNELAQFRKKTYLSNPNYLTKEL